MPKLIYEETENIDRLTAIEVIEYIINNLPKEKAPDPDGFTGKFYKHLRRKSYQFLRIIPILPLSQDRSRKTSYHI